MRKIQKVGKKSKLFRSTAWTLLGVKVWSSWYQKNRTSLKQEEIYKKVANAVWIITRKSNIKILTVIVIVIFISILNPPTCILQISLDLVKILKLLAMFGYHCNQWQIANMQRERVILVSSIPSFSPSGFPG